MNRRYLFIWTLSALLTVFAIAIITCLVDPYGLYRIVSFNGFNQQKEGVRSKIRFVKSLEMPLRSPQTLLMGSSRVHDGLNPDYITLQKYPPVYNFAIDMSRIYETLIQLRHAIKNTRVRRVIIGLDLFMFNGFQRKNEDFDEAIYGRKLHFYDYFGPSIFSRSALSDSVKTLRQSRNQNDRNEFLPNGYRPQAFFKLKNYPAAHYYTNWIFLSPTQKGTKYYSNLKLNDQVFADFEQILSICRENNIELHLYINPAHAHLDGEGLVTLGHWEMNEEWKRHISKLATTWRIPLWDFSGYNSITTERVSNGMIYYWDSSHFKEIVGNWILDRMLGDSSRVPQDFGILVTSDNIESHLTTIRANRNSYVNSHRSEIAILHEDFRRIIGGSPIDLQKSGGMF
jgi:hypothetical protein